MTSVDKPQPSPENGQKPEVEAYLAERMTWIGDAVEVVTGERTGDPLEIFPVPTNPRDAAQPEERFTAKEAELRRIGERFGIGPEQDVVGSAPVRLCEGGKAWKIEAESKIAVEHAETIVFSAAPWRKVGQDELEYMREVHDPELGDGATEYDVARILAAKLDGFEPLEEEQPLPFGYELSDGNPFVAEDRGQLVQIGTAKGKPVMMLRVDQDKYTDDEGKTKPRFRPDTTRLMRFVSEVLTACGDEESGVGMDTSNTYASRVIDTVIAGYENGRLFDVGMYGRATLLGLVEGTQGFADGVIKIPAKTPINQLPAEFYVLAEKLAALEATIS